MKFRKITVRMYNDFGNKQINQKDNVMNGNTKAQR